MQEPIMLIGPKSWYLFSSACEAVVGSRCIHIWQSSRMSGHTSGSIYTIFNGPLERLALFYSLHIVDNIALCYYTVRQWSESGTLQATQCQSHIRGYIQKLQEASFENLPTWILKLISSSSCIFSVPFTPYSLGRYLLTWILKIPSFKLLPSTHFSLYRPQLLCQLLTSEYCLWTHLELS